MARTADPHRREDILDAARQAFLKHGYDETKMTDIARRARMAVGTLYLYFDSKDEIIRAIAAEHFARAARVIVPIFEQPLTKARIGAIVERTFDAVFEDPSFGVDTVPLSDVFPTLAPAAYDAIVGRIAGALEIQMDAGIVRRYDAATLADYIVILLRRAVLESAMRGNRQREPYASNLARLLSSALLTNTSRPAAKRRLAV